MEASSLLNSRVILIVLLVIVILAVLVYIVRNRKPIINDLQRRPFETVDMSEPLIRNQTPPEIPKPQQQPQQQTPKPTIETRPYTVNNDFMTTPQPTPAETPKSTEIIEPITHAVIINEPATVTPVQEDKTTRHNSRAMQLNLETERLEKERLEREQWEKRKREKEQREREDRQRQEYYLRKQQMEAARSDNRTRIETNLPQPSPAPTVVTNYNKQNELLNNKQIINNTPPVQNKHHKQLSPTNPRDDEVMSNISPAKIIKYNFSKEIEYHNPPIDRYLNLERARRYIIGYTHMPKKLENYKIHSNTIDIAPNWDSNTDHLGTMATAMLEGVRFVHYGVQKPNKIHENDIKVCLSYVEDFINRLLKKAENTTNPHDVEIHGLWGNNWYTFAIPVCSFLAQYLLLEKVQNDKIKISNFILRVITSPCKVFNRTRTMYEARLLGPWLLAKHFKNELANAISHPDYIKARTAIMAKFQYDASASGLHMDMSWLSYKLIPAYDSLRDSVSEKALFYFYLDESIYRLPTLSSMYIIAIRIVSHPEIALGNIGLFGRRLTNYAPVDEKAELGISVQPLSRYIHYNTAVSQFNVRAQSMHLSFAQLDKDTAHVGKFWVQYRDVHYTDTPERKLEYPAPGIVSLYKQNGAHDVLKFNETVTTFFLTAAISTVMKYKHIGVMWQSYKLSVYENNVSYREYILMNANTKTISIFLEIINDSGKDLEFNAANNEIIKISRKTTQCIKTLFTIDDRNIVITDNVQFSNFPITIDVGIQMQHIHSQKAFVLFDNTKPKVATLYDNIMENTPISVIISGTAQAFAFDSEQNQCVA